MIRSFNGKTPKIAESAFISEAAYIIGDVEIGENSSVWPGAVIRGDFGKIKIGRNCAVEDNCVIHTGSPTTTDNRQDIVIGDNVQIGHGAVVNCRKIGNNNLLGMNCTVLHDAEIGDLCVIAAGCVVGERMKIPDKSFVVGIPGRIKGEASAKQLWWVQGAPEAYTKLAQQYKEQEL
jgi:carbonic anhydrase/acetyltransferase-like protein (isoleucine patch superfamily)